jgi:hypothetical protein
LKEQEEGAEISHPKNKILLAKWEKNTYNVHAKVASTHITGSVV